MSGERLSNADVVLKTYDVLELSFTAVGVEEAVAAVKADLEVLSREQLVQVATALAVESTRVLPAPGDAVRMHRRMQQARMLTMWEGSA